MLDFDFKNKFEKRLWSLAMLLAFLEQSGVDFHLAFSGRGFHLYVELLAPMRPNVWRELQERFIALAKRFETPVDDRIKDLARPMRLIGTVNWKSEVPKPTFWVTRGEFPVDTTKLEAILPPAERAGGSRRRGGIGFASVDVDKWAREFSRFWKKGIRHVMALGIAGTLAKKGVPASEALKLVATIADMAGDEEVKDRIRAVLDTYALEGWDKEALLDACKEVIEDGLCSFSEGRENEVATLSTLVERYDSSFREALGDEFGEFKELVVKFTRYVTGRVRVRGMNALYFELDFINKTVSALIMRSEDKFVNDILLAGVPTKVLKLDGGVLYVEVETASAGHKKYGPTDVGALAKIMYEEPGVWSRKSYDPKALVKDLIHSILSQKPPSVEVEGGARQMARPLLVEEQVRARGGLEARRGRAQESFRPPHGLKGVLRRRVAAHILDLDQVRAGRANVLYIEKKVRRERPSACTDQSIQSWQEHLGEDSRSDWGDSADTLIAFAQLISSGLSPVFIDEGKAFLEKVEADSKFKAAVKRLFSEALRTIGTPLGRPRTYEPRKTFMITVNEEFRALPQIARRMAAVEFPEATVRQSEEFERLERKGPQG